MLGALMAVGPLFPDFAGMAQAARSYRMSVNVDLVITHVAVRDPKGRIVSGLSQKDFTVREDGARQAIRLFRPEDVPVTVGLVIDHSGSMGEKLNDVIAAARTFARASNPLDQMFVVNFNERVALGLPAATPFSNLPDELELAIRKEPAAGQTALYDALYLSLEKLQPGGRDKNVLIVVSDGGDNASRRSLNEVLQLAGQCTALIYTIGIASEDDADQNPGVLKRLAQSTGGEAFFPGRRSEVVAICERIARDIRSQYTIGYFSSNSKPSAAYRRIRVTAGPSGSGRLSVRARSGYYPLPAGNAGAK